MADQRKFERGTRVRWSARFLRQIGCTATDPMWREWGTVESIRKLGPFDVATVKWDGDSETTNTNVENLCKQGELSHRTACID